LREENKFQELERAVFRAIVGLEKGEVGEPLNQLYVSCGKDIYTNVNVTVFFQNLLHSHPFTLFVPTYSVRSVTLLR